MAIEYSTAAQKGTIHKLLAQLKILHRKPDLAKAFSDGVTSSTTELTKAQANDLIRHLMAQAGVAQKERRPGLSESEKKEYALKCQNMRNKLISLGHNMGWQDEGKINMKQLNNWLEKYAGKELNKLNLKELQNAVTRLEQYYQYYLKKS